MADRRIHALHGVMSLNSRDPNSPLVCSIEGTWTAHYGTSDEGFSVEAGETIWVTQPGALGEGTWVKHQFNSFDRRPKVTHMQSLYVRRTNL
jgi:hypothetical protein